jgi:sugar lactone lactonase YvrE
LGTPEAIAVDGSRNLYIADTSDFTIRKVSASSGTITTLVHLLADSQIPVDVALSPSGDIFFAANGNSASTGNAVYKISSGTKNVTRFAGTGVPGFSGDTGSAASAQLSKPQGVFVDNLGNVFIADTGNNRIREVQASTGIIVTVAGNGTAGFAGDGGAATSAELDGPTAVCLDGAGNVFIADKINNRIRKVAASTGLISTVVGTGVAGFSGDGGVATAAELSRPLDVLTDSNGDLLISDSTNKRVRKVTTDTQVIQTVAGNGTDALGGDGFAATRASLLNPMGLAIDGNGDVLIADTANNAIRKIVTATGVIDTIAGTGIEGYTGDGALATSAQLYQPTDVAVDAQGNIFIADNGNLALREISAANGQINTVGSIPNCGRPCTAYVASTAPGVATTSITGGVYVDPDGNVFRADTVNCLVTRQASGGGSPTTIAGSSCGFSGDGGPATAAQLSRPTYITGDSHGNIFVTDSDNQVIREIVAATGFIVTIAGNGTMGFCGDGGPATLACFNTAQGLAVDPNSQLWVADSLNQRVRSVTGSLGAPAAALSTTSLTFSPAVMAGSSAPPQTVTLTNQGSAGLALTSISFATGNTADFTQTNNCGTSVAPLASCSILVTFTPTAGGTRAATLQVVDNANGSPHSVVATGTGLDFVLSAGNSSSASVSAGQTATYAIDINPAGGFSGTVTLACTGAPAHATCSVPGSISVTGPVSVPVTVTTTAPALASQIRGEARYFLAFAFMGLALITFTTSTVTPRSMLRKGGVVITLLFLFALAGCGGSGQMHDTGGTPKGSYVLTVAATFSSGNTSLIRNITIDLTVQ